MVLIIPFNINYWWDLQAVAGRFMNIATSTFLILTGTMPAIGQPCGLKVNMFLLPLSPGPLLWAQADAGRPQGETLAEFYRWRFQTILKGLRFISARSDKAFPPDTQMAWFSQEPLEPVFSKPQTVTHYPPLRCWHKSWHTLPTAPEPAYFF